MRSDSTTEQWLPIEGFPDYEVSSLGRVRSNKYRESRVMKPRSVRGYRAACLRRDGQTYYLRVARMVLEAFVGSCPPDHEAAHLDGNKTNDTVENLAWVTHKENVAHRRLHGTYTSGEKHAPAKLRQKDVDEIKRLREDGAPVRELALQFKVHEATVYSLLAGKHWNQFETKG